MSSKVWLGASALLMMAALYMVFIYVPTEATMGIVQRIFYLMVPMGWLALLSFLILFVGSILYLAKREGKWDTLAYCSAEMGLVFATLTLVTGSLWAKPAWGVWWTWEPRLTATLVLWLIYLAYLIVRSYIAEEERRARFAAVIGIIGFIDIPIVILATTLWRGMHPKPLIFEGGLDPAMLQTLLVSIVAFTALFFYLLRERLSIKVAEAELVMLKSRREED